MKIKVFLSFITIISLSCNNKVKDTAQPSTNVDEAGIAKIAQNLIIGSFDDIWSDLDSEKIPQYHTDDFILLENGEVWNNDSIVNYQTKTKLRRNRPQRINRFEFLETKVTGNTVWMAYQNYAAFSQDQKVVGRAHWLESAVAVKTKEGWRLEMLHSTYVKE